MLVETAVAAITTGICYIGLEVALIEIEYLWLHGKTIQLSLENLSREIFFRISNDCKRKSATFEREKSYL